MKESPILFTDPMVRAILEGRKTMTRRVAKHRCGERGQCEHTDVDINEPAIIRHCEHGSGYSRCPYGGPGDQLWVKETFCPTVDCPDEPAIYKASYKEGRHLFEPYWKSSRFMPKAMARIKLGITAVRVERVQDISEEDAKVEGAEPKRWGELKFAPLSLLGGKGAILPRDPKYRYGFYELWDSINAKRGYGWDANPWVWVIEFKRITNA